MQIAFSTLRIDVTTPVKADRDYKFELRDLDFSSRLLCDDSESGRSVSVAKLSQYKNSVVASTETDTGKLLSDLM